MRRRMSREAREAIGYYTPRGAEGKRTGVVSVYGDRRVPTGRKKDGNGFLGDGNPPNKRLRDLLNGDLAPAELLDEELAFGVPVCDDGKFSIRAAAQAANLPKKLQAQMRRELIKRTKAKLDGGALTAVNAMLEILESETADENARMKVAQYLIDRFMGKTPEKVEIATDKPYQIIQQNILVGGGTRAESRARRGLPEHGDYEDVIDAEVIDEEE